MAPWNTNVFFSCWKYLVRFVHRWEILSALENTIRIPARPCNISKHVSNFSEEYLKNIISHLYLLSPGTKIYVLKILFKNIYSSKMCSYSNLTVPEQQYHNLGTKNSLVAALDFYHLLILYISFHLFRTTV